MYEGFLLIDGKEVINNHRVYAYAERAGLNWLRECSFCESVETSLGGPWVSPYQDMPHPPWWVDTVKDSHRFFGFYGLSVSGTDDDTREVAVQEYLFDGGSFGRGRRGTREMLVRAVAVAADDAALGYGLSWLRTFDRRVGCSTATAEMYLTCPCVCASDCGSKECLNTCVEVYRRQFRRVRITSGPKIISRPTLSHGAAATVEFLMVAADPQVYTKAGVGIDRLGAVGPVRRRAMIPSVAPDTTNAGLLIGSPLPVMDLPSTWDARMYPFTVVPQFGENAMVPNLGLTNKDTAQSITVRLLSSEGEVVGDMVLKDVEAHEQVFIDYSARKVWRRSSESDPYVIDLMMAITMDGSPVLWPWSFEAGSGTFEVSVPAKGTPPEVDLSALLYRAG
jgi:hypothetical protein